MCVPFAKTMHLLLYSLGYDVLKPVPVLVLESRHDELAPLPPGRLQLEEGGWGGFAPLGQKDDEGEGLQRLLKQTLEMADHRVHQLLAERGVGLERSAKGLKVQDRPRRKH